mmetsp:Transcript_3065/g.3238  ORF Transcript_3065/g.3238 Transcript_3065/m.3238 type:complete len:272 (+) Transcript_3065:75-890(+)
MSEPSESPKSSINQFTEQEITAITDAQKLLVSEGFPSELISIPELALVTMNCKLQIGPAVLKYKRWLSSLEAFGIRNFDEIWDEIKRDGSGDWDKLAEYFSFYHGCGKHNNGENVMWIKAVAVPIGAERQAIKASVIYHRAIHSNFDSLRNGIVFVIDTQSKDLANKIGNESKLQRATQSTPSRPQAIYIIEPNLLKRMAINALVYIASFFTKEKVLKRMKFVEMEDVTKHFDQESLPVYVGGEGGGITDIPTWVKSQLEAFHPNYSVLLK